MKVIISQHFYVKAHQKLNICLTSNIFPFTRISLSPKNNILYPGNTCSPSIIYPVLPSIIENTSVVTVSTKSISAFEHRLNLLFKSIIKAQYYTLVRCILDINLF